MQLNLMRHVKGTMYYTFGLALREGEGRHGGKVEHKTEQWQRKSKEGYEGRNARGGKMGEEGEERRNGEI